MSFPSLPSDWVIDWRRFYDFSKREGPSDKSFNLARLIDTKLASTFERLPEFAHIPEKHLRSLAVRDLLVGQAVGLPSGQDVAEVMKAKGIKVQELLPHQIKVARGRGTINATKREFERQTPLWYYILQEAADQQQGNKLGQVGSYIVSETLHALIAASDHSILREESWKPEPSLNPQDSSKFTMVDLLTFANDIDPVGDYLKARASA